MPLTAHARLLLVLLNVRHELEVAILLTPTGEIRNQLTDANIHLGAAIMDLQKQGEDNAMPEL